MCVNTTTPISPVKTPRARTKPLHPHAGQALSASLLQISTIFDNLRLITCKHNPLFLGWAVNAVYPISYSLDFLRIRATLSCSISSETFITHRLSKICCYALYTSLKPRFSNVVVPTGKRHNSTPSICQSVSLISASA